MLNRNSHRRTILGELVSGGGGHATHPSKGVATVAELLANVHECTTLWTNLLPNLHFCLGGRLFGGFRARLDPLHAIGIGLVDSALRMNACSRIADGAAHGAMFLRSS